MIKKMRLAGLASLMLASGCVPRSEAPPQQPAPVPPRPSPSPPPPPAPVQNWSDIPLTPGSWSYSNDDAGSQATFGTSFAFRCDRRQLRIILSRQGAATGSQMAIRTSFGARNVPIAVQGGASAHSDATFSPSDPFLDSVVFSRGRFTVEAPGLPMLVIPTWPEPARVIEDCRG